MNIDQQLLAQCAKAGCAAAYRKLKEQVGGSRMDLRPTAGEYERLVREAYAEASIEAYCEATATQSPWRRGVLPTPADADEDRYVVGRLDNNKHIAYFRHYSSVTLSDWWMPFAPLPVDEYTEWRKSLTQEAAESLIKDAWYAQNNK